MGPRKTNYIDFSEILDSEDDARVHTNLAGSKMPPRGTLIPSHWLADSHFYCQFILMLPGIFHFNRLANAKKKRNANFFFLTRDSIKFEFEITV